MPRILLNMNPSTRQVRIELGGRRGDSPSGVWESNTRDVFYTNVQAMSPRVECRGRGPAATWTKKRYLPLGEGNSQGNKSDAAMALEHPPMIPAGNTIRARRIYQANTTDTWPTVLERDTVVTTMSIFRPSRVRHSIILVSEIPRNWPRNSFENFG